MNTFLFLLIIFDIALFFFGFFVVLLPVIRGAPWVKSNPAAIAQMIKFADIQPNMKIVDLGSGDGNIVITLAKMGVEAHGYEINPLLVFWSRQKIKHAKLQGAAFIHQGSFWNQSLSRFDVIIVYGIGHIMKDLEAKLIKEVPLGTKIISNVFKLPTLTPTQKEGRVYLYVL